MLIHNLAKNSAMFLKCSFSMAANSNKNPYDILGVSKSATSTEIKKAYYKLAQSYHPDKNTSPQAKDKFAEINNAYQILSDDSKRQYFDQTGSTDENPFGGGQGGQGGFNQEDIFNAFRNAGGQNPNMNMGGGFGDIFEELFGGGGGQKRGRGGQQQNSEREDIMAKLDIEFKQSVEGVSKTIQYQKKEQCGTCKGSKAKPGTKPQKCNVCQGNGFTTLRQGMMVFRTECNSCEGEGTKISSPCGTCSGKGLVFNKVQEQIKVPRGADNGINLKFRSKGHMGGDLIVKLAVKRHNIIKRQGNDAKTDLSLNLVQAVLGADMQIETIYGQKKKVYVKAGIQNGDKIRMPGEGFYRVNSTEKGSHVITVNIVTPTSISEKEKNLYEQLRDLTK